MAIGGFRSSCSASPESPSRISASSPTAAVTRSAYTITRFGKQAVDQPPAWIQIARPPLPGHRFSLSGQREEAFRGRGALQASCSDRGPARRRRSPHVDRRPPGQVRRASEGGGDLPGTRHLRGYTDPHAIHARFRSSQRCSPCRHQEFGQGKTLRVGRNPAAGEVPLTQFAKKRWDFLLDPEGGFAVNGSLDAQYIIVPESLDRSIAQDFQDRLEKTVRRLAKRSYSFSRIVYADARYTDAQAPG